jgi:hypothetical protein
MVTKNTISGTLLHICNKKRHIAFVRQRYFVTDKRYIKVPFRRTRLT